MRAQESLEKSELVLSAHLTVQLCRAHISIYSIAVKDVFSLPLMVLAQYWSELQVRIDINIDSIGASTLYLRG